MQTSGRAVGLLEIGFEMKWTDAECMAYFVFRSARGGAPVYLSHLFHHGRRSAFRRFDRPKRSMLHIRPAFGPPRGPFLPNFLAKAYVFEGIGMSETTRVTFLAVFN